MDKNSGLDLCDAILELMDELPPRWERWAEGKKKFINSVRDFTEDKNFCSEKQYDKLEEIKVEVEDRL